MDPTNIPNLTESTSATTKMATTGNEEIKIKYTVQCLNKGYNNTDGHDTIRVRKAYIKPGAAWTTLTKELKKECNYGTIRKIKYIDKENDKIYIVDGEELESAIFKEGILKFDIMFFKHEIIYTVQYINNERPDEPNEEFGVRKAYPAAPNGLRSGEPVYVEGLCRRKSMRKKSFTSSMSVWDTFLHTIQQTSKNAVIKKIKYTDHYENEICIVNHQELENAIFIEGSYKFHILIEVEIMYTAQHIEAKKPDKPDKSMGIRKAYPLPSTFATSCSSAWHILSNTITQMYASADVKKIKYTDNRNNDVYIVNGEELEKAIFREGIGMFHVLYHY